MECEKERLSVRDYKLGVQKGSERYSSRDNKTQTVLGNPSISCDHYT